MSDIKLFAKIHTTKELGKGNLIIDIEVISLDDKGILPNTDFIIKAGGIRKNRTTNNEGFYKNDEVFESLIAIDKIELHNKEGKIIAEYFLPYKSKSSSISTSSDKSLLYAEICSLIGHCGFAFEDESMSKMEYYSKVSLDKNSDEILIEIDSSYRMKSSNIYGSNTRYLLLKLNTIIGCSDLIIDGKRDYFGKYYFHLYADFETWLNNDKKKQELTSYQFISEQKQIKKLHKLFKTLNR